MAFHFAKPSQFVFTPGQFVDLTLPPAIGNRCGRQQQSLFHRQRPA